MYGLSVYIKSEDIINKLSDEEKKRFNRCVFTDVRKDMDSGITIDCVVFNDPDPCVNQEYNRYRLFSEDSTECKIYIDECDHEWEFNELISDPIVDDGQNVICRCSKCGATKNAGSEWLSYL